MTRPAWLDDPKIRAAVDAAVDAAPPLTADQQDLLRRIGFCRPAPALSVSPSAVRRGAGRETDNGVAGPREPALHSGDGQSALRRPATPTTTKTRRGATRRVPKPAAG